MEELNKTFDKMDIKKVEKNQEFKELYDKVKNLLENNIFEDCYIFEYIEQYNHTEYVNPDDMYINENKQLVNDLKYKKRKDIIKFNISGFTDKEKYIQNVIEWINEGHDDVQFVFNRDDNMKNPNKHIYKILSTICSDEYEISYLHNPDGEQETMVRVRNIIPISLKPFKM